MGPSVLKPRREQRALAVTIHNWTLMKGDCYFNAGFPTPHHIIAAWWHYMCAQLVFRWEFQSVISVWYLCESLLMPERNTRVHVQTLKGVLDALISGGVAGGWRESWIEAVTDSTRSDSDRSTRWWHSICSVSGEDWRNCALPWYLLRLRFITIKYSIVCEK